MFPMACGLLSKGTPVPQTTVAWCVKMSHLLQ